MKNNPLTYFVGGAVICAILLAVVTRDKWQGTPGAAQTAAATSTQTASAESESATTQTSQSEAAQTSQTETTPAKPEPQQQAAVEPKAEPAETEPEQETQPQQQAEPEPPVRPTFGASVEPDGQTLFVGEAAPGSTVSIMQGDKVIGETVASDLGQWVLGPLPVPPGAHNFTASATTKDGRTVNSNQSVAIVVAEQPDQQALVVKSEPSQPSEVLQKPKSEPEPAKTAQAEAEKDQPATEQTMAAAETGSEPSANQTEAETAEPEKAEAEPEPAKDPEPADTKQAEAEPEPSATQASEAEPEPAKEPEPAQTQVAKAEPEPTPEPAPKPKAPLTLETVDYNDAGDIIFSGRSEADGTVRIYVDNQHVGDAEADNGGTWVFRGTENIESGVHRLRIDQVMPDGKVVQRREFPFERADPDRVAELQSAQTSSAAVQQPEPAPKATEQPLTTEQPQQAEQTEAADEPETAAQPEPEVDETTVAAVTKAPEPVAPGRIVIQPGNNLWNISRVIYGRGIEYTTIYEANKDQIRNPHRIYPGQIFTTPGAVPPEEIDPKRRKPLAEDENETQ